MHKTASLISRRRIVAAGLLALPIAGLARLMQTEDVQAADVAVTIMNFAFMPSPITVPVGTTVVWTNQDTAPHTATSDTAGIFDTGMLQKGQSGKVTFNTAGTFTYFCRVHPNMHGTVIVTAAAGTTTTTAPSPSAAAPAPAPAPVVAPAPAPAPVLPPPPPPSPSPTTNNLPYFVRRLGDG